MFFKIAVAEAPPSQTSPLVDAQGKERQRCGPSDPSRLRLQRCFRIVPPDCEPTISCSSAAANEMLLRSQQAPGNS